MTGHPPKFARPPVIETVLGAQFKQLPLKITHTGLFWEKIKNCFPNVEHHEPLEPLIESFDEPLATEGTRWKVFTRPELPRVWYLSEASHLGQQLIQLQSDHFLQNWRRGSVEEQDYPSYDDNKKDFIQSFGKFSEFVDEYGLGPVLANQCEVSYINHIPVEANLSFGEMAHKCFPMLNGQMSDPFLPATPERNSMKLSYSMGDKMGRLHLQTEPALTKSGGQRVLVFTLTARGAPEEPSLHGILRWFDLGHEWVVNGFRSFTSAVMHRHWQILGD
jgi:uncharacterized protein (TIGR04255 family)